MKALIKKIIKSKLKLIRQQTFWLDWVFRVNIEMEKVKYLELEHTRSIMIISQPHLNILLKKCTIELIEN